MEFDFVIELKELRESRDEKRKGEEKERERLEDAEFDFYSIWKERKSGRRKEMFYLH